MQKMNKTKEKTSPIEKEKLKKRLQTLFQDQMKDKSGKKRNSVENRRFQTDHVKQNLKATKNTQQKNVVKSQQSPQNVKSEKKKVPSQQHHHIKEPAIESPGNIKENGTKNPNSKNKNSLQGSSAKSSSKSKHQQKPLEINKHSQSNKTKMNGALKSSFPKKVKPNTNATENTQKPKVIKKQKKVTPLQNTKMEEPLKKQNKTEVPIGGSASFKANKNQKKNKIKKRKSSVETLREQPVSNKKSKLNTKDTVAVCKKDKSLNYDSSTDEESEFDIKNMNGFVSGGDFNPDSDSNSDPLYRDKEHEYWFNLNRGEEARDVRKMNSKKMKLSEHKLYYSDSDDSDASDDEIEEQDYADYYDDGEEYEAEEEEEEEEHYSDFDEDDYEEEEDSFDYSIHSEEDEYSSSLDYDDNDMSFDYNDDDYQLPGHVQEDLIIHRGTATKRDIKPEDNISFNSDVEEGQIVELQEQETVKVITQPKAYDKEELMKLKYKEKTITELTFQTNNSPITSANTQNDSNGAEDCPKLVPIVDEDGFELYNPDEDEENDYANENIDEESYADEDESMVEYEEYGDEVDDVSLGSEYMELNSDDADSLLSEDINDKYLHRGDDDSDSANEIDENVWTSKHQVDIIDATNCKYVNKKMKKTAENIDESLSDNIKQLPSVKLFKNVDLNTASNILSTTVIDKKKEEEEEKTKPAGMEISPETIEETTESEADQLTETDIEETVPQKQQNQRVKSSTAQSLMNYNTKFFNALDSNWALVLLKDPFYIYGTVRLTLLAGNVEVYGHCLSKNEEVELFSPRGCSVIEIKPANRIKLGSEFDLAAKLKSYQTSFALADLKTISESYNSEHDAVVLLKRNETRKKVVQQFKKFMNENVFPNLNNINVDRPLYNTEYLLRCMINTSNQEQKCLRIPQQWQQLNINSHSRVMVTGGKGVGKSTLLRYLINRHMPQDILLIDLDIGQPEVFIPQTVSCTIIRQPLLGPGFMLNLQPDIAYAVGHTNIALCAHKYIEAVRSLIKHCLDQEKYEQLPWLINTMGYNKGFGLELISVIVKELKNNLTDVVQLQSAKEINNFDSVLFPHVLKSIPRNMFVTEEQHESTTNLVGSKDYRLHVWQSAVQQESRYQKEWEMSAKDLRFAMLLTRLSQALQGHAEWLTDCKPLSASLNEIKIFNLMDNTPLATAEELAKATEANLVYLCHHGEENKPLRCFGLGVVRAIDFHIRQVYLLPAVSIDLLKDVDCLALGEMPLPTSIFTNQGPRVKNTAPFVYNTIAANASKAIKQIYHRPRRFLTGKHKPLD